MVLQERKLVSIAQAERIIRESKTPDEAVDKLKKLYKRQPKAPAPEGGITIQAAHRKYHMHSSTLSRWAQKGIVPVLVRTKNETYLDEIALVEVLKAYRKNSGQGKWTVKQSSDDEM